LKSETDEIHPFFCLRRRGKYTSTAGAYRKREPKVGRGCERRREDHCLTSECLSVIHQMKKKMRRERKRLLGVSKSIFEKGREPFWSVYEHSMKGVKLVKTNLLSNEYPPKKCIFSSQPECRRIITRCFPEEMRVSRRERERLIAQKEFPQSTWNTKSEIFFM
jgi:hypothetical protein